MLRIFEGKLVRWGIDSGRTIQQALLKTCDLALLS